MEFNKVVAENEVSVDEVFMRAVNRKDFREMDAALKAGADVNVSFVRGITPLHSAVMARNIEMVEWLVKNGGDPARKTTTGDSAFHEAAKAEDPEFIKALLASKNSDVNVVNSLGSTPIMEAASANRTASVKALLAKGANAKHKSNQGSSALLIAATKHNVDMVKALLSAGADANDADSYGVTALISASMVLPRLGGAEGDDTPQMASEKTMQELIKYGAEPNRAAKSGNTPMAEAASCMNKRGLIVLLNAGANPNVHSTAGVRGETTPLMIAAYKHDVDLIERMLANKADVNFTNAKGDNAITMAMFPGIEGEKAQAKAKATIELLLKAGAKMDVGKKAKIGLAVYGVLTESTELLGIAKDQGVLDLPGEDGATAVFHAVARRKMDVMEKLSTLGANFTHVDNHKQNLLHMIAGNPYPAGIMMAIAKMKAQNDEKKRDDAVRLETEAKQSAVDMTKKLVEYGVDINGADEKGETPLHLALISMAFGKVDRAYIDCLVANGADITIRNEKEESAFVQAIKIGNVELAVDWAKKLIAEGKQAEVEMSLYDVSWTAPEHESQVALMKAVFEKLIPLGAKVGYQDDDGQFPLLIAAATNQEDLVGALLDLGADVNQKNSEGEVAAFHTIKENHANITKLLFDRGANPDAVRNDGESLMSIAFRNQRSTAQQQILTARTSWYEAHPNLRPASDEAHAESNVPFLVAKKHSM